MRVLALSDIHSEERVLDGIRSKLARKRYDAIFLVGDVSDHGNVPFVDSLLHIIDGIPTCIVPGNMDDERVRARLGQEQYYLDIKRIRFKNKYEVFGIGGGLRGPFRTPYEYSDDEMLLKLDGIRLGNPSIVLSHSPPFGYFDDVGGDVHIGSRSVLKFIYDNEPFLFICGHVHETKGHIKIGRTHIIKLGPAKKGSAAEIACSYTDKEKNSIIDVNWITLF